jgi:hypothetical protein
MIPVPGLLVAPVIWAPALVLGGRRRGPTGGRETTVARGGCGPAAARRANKNAYLDDLEPFGEVVFAEWASTQVWFPP